MQFIGVLFTPIFLLSFTLEFLWGELKPYRPYLNLLLVIAKLFLAITYTDNLHGWVLSAGQDWSSVIFTQPWFTISVLPTG